MAERALICVTFRIVSDGSRLRSSPAPSHSHGQGPRSDGTPLWSDSFLWDRRSGLRAFEDAEVLKMVGEVDGGLLKL